MRYDTFRMVWDNPEYEQAYVNIGLDAEGKVERITIKAISPIADFSWDFQDLLFTPSPKSGGCRRGSCSRAGMMAHPSPFASPQ